MKVKYKCSRCGEIHDPQTLIYRCPCGGLLDIAEFDIDFPLDKIKQRTPSLWRYEEALPFSKSQQVTLGEGFTSMVTMDNSDNVFLKMDYMMPTLSFKDRGASMLITAAKALHVKRIVADSSGNAGTAIAAYAAKARIKCDIFVPASTSPNKLSQIKAYGAKLHLIPGTREDTADAAIKEVEASGSFYASHVYNPFFYQGTKTYAYEIWEDMNGNVPDAIIVPVGNGTLLLGTYYGFKDLHDKGLIPSIPKFIAVQAEGCAPLFKAFQSGAQEIEPLEPKETQAEGIAIANPARHHQILQVIKETGGEMIAAPEQKIEDARQELAYKGFFVEPTSAATYAGYLTYVAQQGNPIKNLTTVIPLCGAGLKAIK
ncbi:threonine synthase [Oceanobacillus sp. FSL K6-2867]|uniref:threonine synthase n=1 Tax=Oceanobacillus sp. FSL K6-2867 TaxID=2954748 RepID=UPI0030D84B58